jgi:hypothetical protein
VSFSNKRDYHFRQQVQSLQNEMALIANSDLYGTTPLSDSPEDIAKFIDELAASGQLVPEAVPSGRWYAKFVQEVNQTKEERDAELAILMVCWLYSLFRWFPLIFKMWSKFSFRLLTGCPRRVAIAIIWPESSVNATSECNLLLKNATSWQKRSESDSYSQSHSERTV